MRSAKARVSCAVGGPGTLATWLAVPAGTPTMASPPPRLAQQGDSEALCTARRPPGSKAHLAAHRSQPAARTRLAGPLLWAGPTAAGCSTASTSTPWQACTPVPGGHSPSHDVSEPQRCLTHTAQSAPPVAAQDDFNSGWAAVGGSHAERAAVLRVCAAVCLSKADRLSGLLMRTQEVRCDAGVSAACASRHLTLLQ